MTARSDFWSRRKAAVEAEAREAADTPPPEPVDTRTDDEILTEMDLAAPETLHTPEAVKEFLQNDLPARLRTRALRQLWRTNPILANLDGLVDYGEDFTDAATVMDKMETVYQVGKGMMTAFVEEDEAAPAEAPAPQEQADETPDDTEAEAPLIAAAEPHPMPQEVPAPAAAPQPRMRFAFDDADQWKKTI